MGESIIISLRRCLREEECRSFYFAPFFVADIFFLPAPWPVPPLALLIRLSLPLLFSQPFLSVKELTE